MKNWKTTLVGAVMVLSGVVGIYANPDSLKETDPTKNPLSMITAGVGFMASKDHNVTGGTVEQ
jgi:hypothetical protein